MKPLRIAVVGFQHETNTFAPVVAGLAEFNVADSWPPLLRGQRVIDATRGLNLPISGAIECADSHQITVVPILWCAAEPSGPVTTEAFEAITGEIISAVDQAHELDAIYLDLHGAMVTQQHDDGEAELLRRLRAGPASDIPIAVSLDLHANLSARFVERCDVITIYRTYPHLDMALTGTRCMQRLLRCLNGEKLHHAFRQSSYLVPLHAQFTGAEPCQMLYEQVRQLADENRHEYLELAMGFTAADIADCGPSVVASAPTAERAAVLADTMIERFEQAEPVFDTRLYRPDRAVRQAMQISGQQVEKPVVIADVQDNAGAGGTADTTGLLQALIDARATGAVVGVLCDSPVAQLAHAGGKGSIVRAPLGAKSGLPGHLPVIASWQVQVLSDGNIAYTGQMYGGVTAEIGASCLLSLHESDIDLQVVVSSCRTQCLDQALFRHFGVELSSKRIIVVKSTVHYRADFDPICSAVINAAADGSFVCDLSLVQYQKLRPEIRLGPSNNAVTGTIER